MVGSLWKLVRNDGDRMIKESFVVMNRKFHYLVVPPPVDAEKVAHEAERDWVNDSAGGEAIEYSGFFRSIFQLVDIWTDSCDVVEYCSLLNRFIRGVTRQDQDGALMARGHGDSI